VKAWLFQDTRQRQKLGDKCPWSVGWFDPDGKKRSKRIGCRSRAEMFARKVEGQLAAGTYQGESRKKWKQFADEYEADLLARVDPGTRRVALDALKSFSKLIKPGRVDRIRTKTIDQFVALRRAERGRVPGSTVSVATVNKELRHLKAALRKAREWGYLPVVPTFHMLKEPKKLPLYVTPEHLAAIYQACEVAAAPATGNYSAADWWRALLMFGYMTGWRIGEILSLGWDDVSLDRGHAITRHADNKGGRDERVPLHQVVVEHLRKIVDFGPLVFSWPKDRRSVWEALAQIQTAAGIDLPCAEKHEHTDACHRYGFHDLRRAFATMNADRLTGDALQAMMRHSSYSTTQRYINVARQRINRPRPCTSPTWSRRRPRSDRPWSVIGVLPRVAAQQRREKPRNGTSQPIAGLPVATWPRRGSNPHGGCPPRDFKSRASASSATRPGRRGRGSVPERPERGLPSGCRDRNDPTARAGQAEGDGASGKASR